MNPDARCHENGNTRMHGWVGKWVIAYKKLFGLV